MYYTIHSLVQRARWAHIVWLQCSGSLGHIMCPNVTCLPGEPRGGALPSVTLHLQPQQNSIFHPFPSSAEANRWGIPDGTRGYRCNPGGRINATQLCSKSLCRGWATRTWWSRSCTTSPVSLNSHFWEITSQRRTVRIRISAKRWCSQMSPQYPHSDLERGACCYYGNSMDLVDKRRSRCG